jgi:hypothetical protein
MSQLFNSRWPIFLAGMNGASDKRLALAVAEAGGFPSIYVSAAWGNIKRTPNSPLATRDIDFDPMYYELLDLIKCKGDANFSVPIAPKYLYYPQFLKMAKDLQISHWDIFPRWESDQVCGSELLQDDMIYQGIKYLRKFSHVIGRLGQPTNIPRLSAYSVLAVIGTDNGGGQGTMPVKEIFNKQIAMTPNTIPHGGIGTPRQVREYIDAGAPAVAVGTVFAACVESPLSMEVKQKMVESSEVSQINANDKNANVKQNALVFEKSSVTHPDDDSNHSGALYAGINGNGNQGLIMAGHAIKYIDRIRTVKETMEYLTSELN